MPQDSVDLGRGGAANRRDLLPGGARALPPTLKQSVETLRLCSPVWNGILPCLDNFYAFYVDRWEIVCSRTLEN